MQSSALTWTGRVLSALPVLALLMSGGMKISQSPEVMEGLARYGYEAGVVVPIGSYEHSDNDDYESNMLNTGHVTATGRQRLVATVRRFA